MAFKIIETQEELDNIIGERLKREREATEKKYAGFDEAKEKAGKYDKLLAQDFEGQIRKLNDELNTEREKNAGHDQTVSEITARAEKAEKALLKVETAHKAGLPYELAARLNGDTEEELLADAKSLSSYVKTAGAPPLATTEPAKAGGKSDNAAAFAALNAALSTPNM